MRKNMMFARSLLGLLAFGLSQIMFAADTYLGVSDDKLRSGNITFDDVPRMIVSLTGFVLALTGTISLIMIIYGALRMVLGSYEQSVKDGKNTIMYALIGLAISASAWFIIKFVFSSVL